MDLIFEILALFAAGICVAVADSLIKRVAVNPAYRGPLLGVIVVLYAAQVVFFWYVFVRRMRLGIAGNLQMVTYSVATVLLGLLVFRERLSVSQLMGVILAVVGSILMLRQSTP
jgi:drug/metabolite transporter (DMT)-like permease